MAKWGIGKWGIGKWGPEVDIYDAIYEFYAKEKNLNIISSAKDIIIIRENIFKVEK